jgi:hypothetical protein
MADSCCENNKKLVLPTLQWKLFVIIATRNMAQRRDKYDLKTQNLVMISEHTLN